MDGQLRILSLWAFIIVDDDGTEGIIGMLGPQGTTLPLVGADLARVASLRPYAQQLATQTGKPVTVAHFSVRTDAEVLAP